MSLKIDTLTDERHFVIKWEIDEFQPNPLIAIKKAILALPDYHSLENDVEDMTLATVFEVSEMKDGKTLNKFQIDVAEVNPFNLNDVAEFNEKEHVQPLEQNELIEKIKAELKGIAPEDMTTAEQNILKLLATF